MTQPDSAAAPSGRAGVRTRRSAIRRLSAAALLVGSLALAPVAPALATTTPTATAVASADDKDSTVTWGLTPIQDPKKEFRPNFNFELKPGEDLKDSVRVRNYGGAPLKLKVYASDAHNSENGALDLLPGGRHPKDAGSWITLGRNDVTIAPNDFTDIPFTIKVPDKDVESGDHVGGIVASFIGEGKDDKIQVKVDRRIGTRVQIRVAGPLHPQLAITKMHTVYDTPSNPAGTGTMHTRYKVTNTGNVRLAANKVIRVKSPLGFPAHTAHLAPIPELLPGNSIVVVEDVHGVWPTIRSSTKITLTAVPTREGDSFNATDAGTHADEATWSPPWALLLTILVLALAYYLHRRRQQRTQKTHARDLQALVDARLGLPVPVGQVNGHVNGHAGHIPVPPPTVGSSAPGERSAP